MPKILENVKEQLILEARRQIEESGYQKTSIRSVAAACGIATGTVYNYFPSKDMLIATYVFEDWMKAVSTMKADCLNLKAPEEVLRVIYDGLQTFINDHDSLFHSSEAYASYMSQIQGRHGQMVAQITEIAAPVCRGHENPQKAGVTEFVVESLLNWTMQGRDCDDFIRIISRLYE